MLSVHHLLHLLSLITSLLDLCELRLQQVQSHQQDGHASQTQQIVLNALDEGFIGHLLNFRGDCLQFKDFILHRRHPEFEARECRRRVLGLTVVFIDIGRQCLFLRLDFLQLSRQLRRHRVLYSLFV